MTTTSPARLRPLAAALAVLLAASAIAFGAVGGAATAAPDRESRASVDTTYLSDAVGLPSDTVIETVTYDRFQWLLQQPGQFAFLVGNVTDPGFAAKAQEVDATAKAAGASKVYWFDPNLTGLSGIRNLDTRNPSGLNLSATSQTIYGNIWRNVLGQYLGNGIKSVPNSSGSTATVTLDDSVVNDTVDPVWDYRTTATPAVSSSATVFFVYDKDNAVEGAADKVVQWVDLSTNADTPAALAAAIAAAGGGTVIDQLSQFDWWKSSANRKHYQQYVSPTTDRYGGDILEDADAANGWHVQQVTYPELLHLLDKNEAGANFVVLFGGTWCHNTRAVVKQINAEAYANGVQTVYNFDWVLDGGTVNGTNGGGNPVHTRDNRNGSGANNVNNFRPSWVTGDVFNTYFPNVVTEYNPASNGVSYHPGGDLTAAFQTARKGQVPFLLHYERGTGANPSSTSVQRQWIQRNVNSSTGAVTYKEYMTEWWFTNPSPQIGLNFAIPADETTLSTSQRSQLNTARANVAFGQEAVVKLTEFFQGVPASFIADPQVTAPDIVYGNSATITVTVPTVQGHAPTGTATLSINGATQTSGFTGNTATFTVPGLLGGSNAFTIDYADDANIVDFQRSGIVNVTKANLSAVAGAVSTLPTTTATGVYEVTASVPSGLVGATGDVTLTLTKGAATHTVSGTAVAGVAHVTVPALPAGTWGVSIAYGGDSNYSATTGAGSAFTVVRPATDSGVDGSPITYGETATITLTVPTTGGNTPSGTAELVINGTTYSSSVTGNTTEFTVPGLVPATYPYSVSYTGDENILDFTLWDGLVVNKTTVSSVTGTLVTTPSTTAGGSYKVTVVAPSGLAPATGNASVTLSKGAVSFPLTAPLAAGEATVSLPNLAAGAWSVSVEYAGDAHYESRSVSSTGFTVANPPAPPAAATNAAVRSTTTNSSNSGGGTTTAPPSDADEVLGAEDPEPTPTPTEEPSPEPSSEPEPTATEEAPEEVQAAPISAPAEGLPQGILILGGLLGLSLLGYVGLRVFQGWSARP